MLNSSKAFPVLLALGAALTPPFGHAQGPARSRPRRSSR